MDIIVPIDSIWFIGGIVGAIIGGICCGLYGVYVMLGKRIKN